MEFVLNPFLKRIYRLPAIEVQPNGQRKRIEYPIEPDFVYDTKDFVERTPNIEDLIKNQTTFVDYNSDNLRKIKAVNAKYDFIKCASCGGKITKIRLFTFQEA